MIGLAGMFMNGNYEVDPGNWTRLMLNHYREDLQVVIPAPLLLTGPISEVSHQPDNTSLITFSTVR